MSPVQQAFSPRMVAVAVLVLYLLLLGFLTFRPVGSASDSALRLNLRPLATIGPALRLGPGSFPFSVLVGNLLAFMPLGILLPIARRRSSWIFVIAVGLALSVAIELGQLGLSIYLGLGYRSADVDDVILNVAGTTSGLAIFAFVMAIARLAKRGRRAR